MLCPESPELPELEDEVLQPETKNSVKEENRILKENRNVPVEGADGVDFSSFRSPKTWKKTISMFFRNQIRSTRSNDGDRPSGSHEQFPEDDTLSPEHKWQSLGKMFRRQHMSDHNKSGSPEDHTHKKSAVVKRVWSHYFGKNSKSSPPPPPPVTELTDEKK